MRKWLGLTVALAVVAGGGWLYTTGTLADLFGRPVLSAELPAAAESDGASFAAGQATYTSLDFNGARAIWRAVAENENADAEERGNAFRALGRVSWRLWADPVQALALIQQADEVDPGNSDTFTQRTYALIAAGAFDEAFDASVQAVALADDSEESGDASRAMASAALASAGETAPDDLTADQHRQLAAALEAMRPAIDNAPADLETSELAVAVAMRVGDGPALLAAWQSYYHHPSGLSAMADMRGPAAILQEHLPGWSWTAAQDEQRVVASALTQSFFFDEAALMVRAIPALASDPQLSRAVIYNDFIKELRDVTNGYYRHYAIGEMTFDDFTAAVAALLADHGERLYPGEGYTMDTSRAFVARIREEFSAYANIGTTSGVLDLHYGHITLDTDHAVSQYGYEASVGYAVVGRMVSNGYESWVWDGAQQHGGWANSERIYQVRPAYASGPLRSWNQISEPALRMEAEERTATLRAADAALAEGNQPVYLAGLARALRQQGEQALYDDIRAGFPEDQARFEFITQLATATRDSSIFAHEGRHALDNVHVVDQGTPLSSEEMEFRAKLSEVAFARYPRLAFGSIFNGNMGNGTSHGEANERVTAGLIAWMDAHQSQIAGLDGSAPLLPQFDKLTDAQMVAAVQSLDPWASAED